MNSLQQPQVSALLPLLKSIRSELRDRAHTITRLEERLEAFSASKKLRSNEIADLQAELAINRRELRRCHKELTRLGCSVDENDPTKITGPEGMDPSWQLGDTHFWSTADTTA